MENGWERPISDLGCLDFLFSPPTPCFSVLEHLCKGNFSYSLSPVQDPGGQKGQVGMCWQVGMCLQVTRTGKVVTLLLRAPAVQKEKIALCLRLVKTEARNLSAKADLIRPLQNSPKNTNAFTRNPESLSI